MARLNLTLLNSQEQRSISTPILIQGPQRYENSSGSQDTLVDNESIEQGDHPFSQLRPPLLHVRPAKVEQHHSPKSKNKSILKEWSSEMAMLALSILLFTAIVILLRQSDNHPMPSWSFHLNVNSMVAILSTLLRSSLFMILEQGLLHITGHLSRLTDESIIVISQLKWTWHTHPRPLQHLQYYDHASRSPWGSFIFFFRIRHL